MSILKFPGIHEAADRRIVRAHALADIREAIAVIHVRTANDLPRNISSV
jgi:hypothetical protein